MIEKREETQGFALVIGDVSVLWAQCPSVIDRAARICSRARDAPYRDAMRMLTQEIGFCDEAANNVYLSLVNGGSHAVN